MVWLLCKLEHGFGTVSGFCLYTSWVTTPVRDGCMSNSTFTRVRVSLVQECSFEQASTMVDFLPALSTCVECEIGIFYQIHTHSRHSWQYVVATRRAPRKKEPLGRHSFKDFCHWNSGGRNKSWDAPGSGRKSFLASTTPGPCGVDIASVAAILSRSAGPLCPCTNTSLAAEEALLSASILERFKAVIPLRHTPVWAAAMLGA